MNDLPRIWDMRGTGVSMDDSSPVYRDQGTAQLYAGKPSEEAYPYWVISPDATELHEQQRSTQWTLAEMMDAVECEMIEMIRLAPALPADFAFTDTALKDWERFHQEYCMVVDEEFLIRETRPAFNPFATVMRGGTIHGTALVTPWASID